jgi:tetratricopeptide (TPR) repeat protein
MYDDLQHGTTRGKLMKTAITSIALLLSAGLAMSVPALAAGGGGDSGSSQNNCKKGLVWSVKKNKCVQKNAGLDQESIYLAGRDLAQSGRYEEAIDVLSIGADRGDKRILNYLGYSHRKAGRIDVGLTFYRQALDIDPQYTLVREYLGEALLQKGDLKGALDQLAEIRRLCQGRGCGEYQELSGQIADFIRNQDS